MATHTFTKYTFSIYLQVTPTLCCQSVIAAPRKPKWITNMFGKQDADRAAVSLDAASATAAAPFL